MVGADPFANVGQKGLAVFAGVATEFDSPLATAIELAINQHIHLGLAGNPFCLNVVLRELLELEILQ
jgi:hypothetical protein